MPYIITLSLSNKFHRRVWYCGILCLKSYINSSAYIRQKMKPPFKIMVTKTLKAMEQLLLKGKKQMIK